MRRMKRSTSQEAVNGDRPFKRGGVRATAGARLGGHTSRRDVTQTPKSDSFITPFDQWTTDQVKTRGMVTPQHAKPHVYNFSLCDAQVAVWLSDLGLPMYVNDCRRWCKGGQHMLESTKHEIEKELKIHHPLHKKKLQLALHSMCLSGITLLEPAQSGNGFDVQPTPDCYIDQAVSLRIKLIQCIQIDFRHQVRKQKRAICHEWTEERVDSQVAR